MRSRSSLLAHLLMESEQIFGMGESNRVYNSNVDLLKARIKTRLSWKIILPLKFTFLDQINHNEKTPDLSLFSSWGKILFLVRAPAETFESIRRMTKQHYQEWPHEKIERYYRERMQFLLTLKQGCSEIQGLTIPSEELVQDSDKCLTKIGEFLGLQAPLHKKYRNHAFTGKHGDPSDNIRSGEIKRTPVHQYSKEISSECIDLFKAMHGDSSN
ncbi:MAG: sulfotransferase [Saprospiraceae bacterium]|nr:sulfotransferase [Saprospiraceae bacterium]